MQQQRWHEKDEVSKSGGELSQEENKEIFHIVGKEGHEPRYKERRSSYSSRT